MVLDHRVSRVKSTLDSLEMMEDHMVINLKENIIQVEHQDIMHHQKVDMLLNLKVEHHKMEEDIKHFHQSGTTMHGDAKQTHAHEQKQGLSTEAHCQDVSDFVCVKMHQIQCTDLEGNARKIFIPKVALHCN